MIKNNVSHYGVHARSDFWRAISHAVGDDHADWICDIVSLYCWVRGVSSEHVMALRRIGRTP